MAEIFAFHLSALPPLGRAGVGVRVEVGVRVVFFSFCFWGFRSFVAFFRLESSFSAENLAEWIFFRKFVPK